ncbi:MAG TPA: VCBS domain-containing protein, partial [Pseudolabrys sp.]|nr:VCBS domain-containing protein [Pseudolabrys sp.]
MSDSARAVVKEFGCDGAEPSALFDISRGTFAFIAGEVAKLGRLGIETPFASIRGRAQSGGIGMLSLASLFFAALDNAHGTTTPPGLEDGIINLRDSNDIINAPFGIIELTVGGQTIFIDTPLAEFVVRGTSVSQVPLSLTQLQQYIIESINVQNIAGVGQPTVGGPSGSGGLPPPGPPPFVEPINFVPPPVPPSGGPTGGTNSSGTGVDIFIPPPPPPPPPLGPGEIREIINVTNSGTIDSTDGPLPVGGPYELTSLTWSGGDLSDAQRDSLKQGTFTPSGSTYTYTIADHLLDFVAGNETVKITYTSTVDPTQSVTITVFGTNDRPVITSVAQSATLAEASETAAQNPSLNAGDLTTNGTLNFTDIDITDANHSPHVTVAQSGTTNAALTDPIALSLF